MLNNTLRKIGLSEGEIKIYTALLKSGNATANEIHEQVGIERRNIYDILNKLIDRGFVSYINENKRRMFKVTNPKRLLDYLDEKTSTINDIKEDIKEELPQMEGFYNQSRVPIEAQTFRGEAGIKAVWEDVLNYPESHWIAAGYYVPGMYPNFFKHWQEKRLKTKKPMHVLFRSDDPKGGKRNFKLHTKKILPDTFNGAPTVIAVFGNKVCNFIYGDNLFAFVIESEELAENYRRYFWFLWDNVAHD